MATMKRYNIALSPDPATADWIVACARENFGQYAETYLLSEQSLPHITLAQFRAPVEDNLSAIRAALAACADHGLSTSLDGIYRKTSLVDGRTYVAVGLMVQRTDALIGLQAQIADLVVQHSYELLTAPGNHYVPHITFCRVRENDAAVPCAWPDHLLNKPSKEWVLVLGDADNSGQLLRILDAYSPAQPLKAASC